MLFSRGRFIPASYEIIMNQTEQEKIEEKEVAQVREQNKIQDQSDEQPFGKERMKKVGIDLLAFLRSLAMAVLLGIGVGVYSCAFAMLINFLAGVRMQNPWLLYLLPVGGLAIVGFPILLAPINQRLFLYFLACSHLKMDALPHFVVGGVE